MRTDGDVFVLSKGDREIPEQLRQVTNLKLRIWKSGVEHFENLANFPNITELDIFDYRAPSLTPLRALRGLRRLSVIHFPHVSSFEPLSELRQLEELVLETLPSGDASGKRTLVETFRPLARLSQLRVLKLAGVSVLDNDLSPLGELTALEDLALGNLFPQQQFAQLTRTLPHVRCAFLGPFLRLDEYACRRCGGQKVMLSGADVPNPKIVCPVCHRKKFEDTVRLFEQFKTDESGHT